MRIDAANAAGTKVTLRMTHRDLEVPLRREEVAGRRPKMTIGGGGNSHIFLGEFSPRMFGEDASHFDEHGLVKNHQLDD